MFPSYCASYNCAHAWRLPSARRLTDFGSNPAWSPDGQHIVFCTEEVISPYATYSNSTLWTVDLNGSGPTKIQDEVSAYQPAWSPSGRRIAFWQNVQGQRDLEMCIRDSILMCW